MTGELIVTIIATTLIVWANIEQPQAEIRDRLRSIILLGIIHLLAWTVGWEVALGTWLGITFLHLLVVR